MRNCLPVVGAVLDKLVEGLIFQNPRISNLRFRKNPQIFSEASCIDSLFFFRLGEPRQSLVSMSR